MQVVWQEGAPQPPHGAAEEEDFAEDTVAAETEPADEQRGLRGRLSSLIGRDLGDRGDDVEARREPPLKSAPELRVEPADRAIPSVEEPKLAEPAPAALRPDARPAGARGCAQAARGAA